MEGLEATLGNPFVIVNRTKKKLSDLWSSLNVHLQTSRHEREKAINDCSRFTNEFTKHILRNAEGFLAPLRLDLDDIDFFNVLRDSTTGEVTSNHNTSFKYKTETEAVIDLWIQLRKKDEKSLETKVDERLLQYGAQWSVLRSYPIGLYVRGKFNNSYIGPLAFHFSPSMFTSPDEVNKQAFFYSSRSITDVKIFGQGNRIDFTSKETYGISVTKYFYMGEFKTSVLGQVLHVYGTHLKRDEYKGADTNDFARKLGFS